MASKSVSRLFLAVHRLSRDFYDEGASTTPSDARESPPPPLPPTLPTLQFFFSFGSSAILATALVGHHPDRNQSPWRNGRLLHRQRTGFTICSKPDAAVDSVYVEITATRNGKDVVLCVPTEVVGIIPFRPHCLDSISWHQP